MNIGFDLDKIFINTPPFVPARVIDAFYKKKDNGVLLYRIPSYPMQVFRKATHFPLFRPAIKDNLAFLKSISKNDNQLYLISSRFKFLEKPTQQVIKKYQLDKIFDGMYFNFENKQPHEFKNEVIKKLNLDLYVDDDLSLIKHVAKHNGQTRFFWLTPKAKGSLSNNIFAISKLSDMLRKAKIVDQETGIEKHLQ